MSTLRPTLFSSQAGFSLIEVLVAMVLFSITILGLLKYQQVLTAQFSHYADSQSAWRLVAQALDIYPAKIENDSRLDKGHWQLNTQITPMVNGCNKVTVRVTAPGKIEAVLDRWFCD
ncbi:prepilin-type N-terminal cleavage/methylation domain-containing protein [Pragia fontium]|uniref:type IV pilus modification PilV family protein n=1 Tax=Pragia fontium TaxID=82985 RepID=UPI00064A511F|nr:prepilin-type N-terminal cleavage/methylation domain-containing protein [Pragia fontium]AKJ43081.1 hypothetical protein QQ39_14240 [Pragia fontium]